MAQRLKTDWILFLTVLTLVCFGLVMVYSSSSIVAELKYHVSSTHFFLRQLGWAVFSFLVLLYCMRRITAAGTIPKSRLPALVSCCCCCPGLCHRRQASLAARRPFFAAAFRTSQTGPGALSCFLSVPPAR